MKTKMRPLEKALNLSKLYILGVSISSILLAESILAAGGVVEGYVLDMVDQSGVDSISIRLLDGDGNVVTSTLSSASGHFNFHDISAGRYRLKAEPSRGYCEYPISEHTINTSSGAMVSNNITMLCSDLQRCGRDPTAYFSDLAKRVTGQVRGQEDATTTLVSRWHELALVGVNLKDQQTFVREVLANSPSGTQSHEAFAELAKMNSSQLGSIETAVKETSNRGVSLSNVDISQELRSVILASEYNNATTSQQGKQNLLNEYRKTVPSIQSQRPIEASVPITPSRGNASF